MTDQPTSDRPMFQGNWTCADCGTEITELPFQPSGDKPISCRDCHRSKREDNRQERRMFEGNWSCADCGTAITSLPFQPTEDRPIYCRDCHRKSR